MHKTKENKSSYYQNKVNENNVDKLELSGTKNVLILGIIYACSFLFASIFVESNIFSLALAAYSSCITATFEILEWRDYIRIKNKIQVQKHVTILPPLLLSIVIFVVIYFVFDKLNLDLGKNPKLSNIISSIIICFYTLSYSIRRYMKIKDNLNN